MNVSFDSVTQKRFFKALMETSVKFLMKVANICVITFVCTNLGYAEQTFRVCSDPLHPPYSTKKLDGFENKIAELFAGQLQQKVEYTWFPQRIGFIRNTLRAKLPDSDIYKCDVVMGVPAGYELALTTRPYYQSTYVLLIKKNRGWDDIKTEQQLADLSDERKSKLKMAMFDRGPGTSWMHRYDFIDQGIPYQTMTGDHENNTAMRIDKDLKSGKIDMVILWGPMAGYVLSNSPAGSYTAINMQPSPGVRYNFSIAMAVRYGDKKRQQQLNSLIESNQHKINQILTDYQIPLLALPAYVIQEDDDD